MREPEMGRNVLTSRALSFGKTNPLSGYFPSGLLDGRPLGKKHSLSGYFPSDLLDGRPLGK